MCERLVKTVIMQKLSESIINNNGIAIKDAANTEEFLYIVNVYQEDRSMLYHSLQKTVNIGEKNAHTPMGFTRHIHV